MSKSDAAGSDQLHVDSRDVNTLKSLSEFLRLQALILLKWRTWHAMEGKRMGKLNGWMKFVLLNYIFLIMIEQMADCIEYNGRRRTIFIEVVPSTIRMSAEGAPVNVIEWWHG